MRAIAAGMLLAGGALVAGAGGGCAGRSNDMGTDSASAAAFAGIDVAPGAYARTFDQTRDLLRDMGFLLERVDAQEGVITTRPKGTGGIFTPWDSEQTSFGQEFEDALHRNQRIVRVEFAPVNAPAGDAPMDLRKQQGPIHGRVSAAVYRVENPGWRLNTEAVLESSYFHDPELDARGMGVYSVAVRQDDDLAELVARKVRERMLSGQAAMK